MSNERHPCIVPALDWLIGDPDNLDPTTPPPTSKKMGDLYIPIQYIDRLSKFHDEPMQSTRKDSAHKLLGAMGGMLIASETDSKDGDITRFFVRKDGVRINFCDWDCISSGSSTDAAIALSQALEMQSKSAKTHNEVSIITGDNAMLAKAAAKGINILKIVPEVYTGRRKVTLPDEKVGLWTNKNRRITLREWSEIFPDEPPLNPHEFVEMSYSDTGQPINDFSNIGRFDANLDAIVHLENIKLHAPYNQIAPRTPFQAMFLEALMLSPDEAPIVIADCVFGSGKTFLTVLAGLYGANYGMGGFPPERRYDRIFVTPAEGALGHEIGFLPGDQNQKIIPKAMPILDNIYELLSIIKPASRDDLNEQIEAEVSRQSQKNDQQNKNGKKKGGGSGKKRNYHPPRNFSASKEVDRIIDSYFEFQPLINMCGRTISRSCISYDEAQNIEIWQMRELLTRLSDGSKMCITGDTSQITKPHLSDASNGLSWISVRLASSNAAVVLVDKTQESVIRHWALREIIDRIGMY